MPFAAIAAFALPLVGLAPSAFAVGVACSWCVVVAKHGTIPSHTPAPNKTGNTTHYTPIYPPTEPTCVDQGATFVRIRSTRS